MATSLYSEKLDQAERLVKESGAHVWLTFVRETSDHADPALGLILEGGLTWESALMVGANGRKVAVVGNYDADPLLHSGDWDEVIGYVQGIRDDLLRILDQLVPNGEQPRIAVNYAEDDDKADGLTHGMYLRLAKLLQGTRYEGSLESAQAIVGNLRAEKTPRELERMRAAIAEGDKIFELVPTAIRPGITERALYDLIQTHIDQTGLGYGWARSGNPIVNFGPDSMIGHGVPSASLQLEAGHVLHIDLGVIKDGYSSDIQRCWYILEPGETEAPADVRAGLDAVNRAISAAAETLRVGVPGWQVDAAARESIVASGYPEYLHAVGHQVGRVAHDGGTVLAPRWARYGQSPYQLVASGQVYTLELGVTLPRRGYIGIEEMVLVTENGIEWLSHRQLTMPTLSLSST